MPSLLVGGTFDSVKERMEAGRSKQEEVSRKKEEGGRKKGEGRREKEEGRRKKEQGRRKEGRTLTGSLPSRLVKVLLTS